MGRDNFLWLEGDMRVDERIRKAVVFLGRRVDGVRFVPYGTGFVAVTYDGDIAFQQIVTARHVIEDIDSDTIWARVNTHHGPAELLPLASDHCHFHPDDQVDVAVVPGVIPKDRFDILHIPSEEQQLTEEAIEQHSIGVGDEVFIAGMFVSRLGEARNLPIIRIGNIAAMPEEKIETELGYHDAYLIEARSIGGLSGSPVFVQMAPLRLLQGVVTPTEGSSQYLMGIALGHHRIETTQDSWELRSSECADDEDAERERLGRLIPLNSGIGIVLPTSYIIGAIRQDNLVQKRKEALMKGKGEGG